MKEHWFYADNELKDYLQHGNIWGQNGEKKRGMLQGGGEREKILFLPNIQPETFRILPSKQTSY